MKLQFEKHMQSIQEKELNYYLFFNFPYHSFIQISVGLNPKIMTFEQLPTLEVELWTHSNPDLPTNTELRTHPNPPKISNSEPTKPTTIDILEKTSNFKLLQTPKVEHWTLPNQGLPTKTELQTHPNPPNIPELRTHELGSTQH